MVIVYGLTNEIPELAGLSPGQIGDRLRQIGCDGVFLKHLQPDWIVPLQDAGLRVYASAGIFVDNAHLWQRFPESRPITDQGMPAPVEEWYRPLRPTHQEIWQLRLSQVAALAELPLDGVWLDFIRWPARWEKARPQLYDSSFDRETLDQFRQETQVEVPHGDAAQSAAWIVDNALEHWVTWRCLVIERFVTAARACIRDRRPGAMLGLFTIPWRGDAAGDGTGIADAGRRIVGQDLQRLGRQADVLSPMVYHRLCGRGSNWVSQVCLTAAQQSAAAIWPVVEAIDGPDQYPADEFAAVLQEAEQVSGHTIVFKLEGLLADPAKQAALRATRKG